MKYLILWKGHIPLDIIVEKILREHSNGISCSVIFFKHYPTVGHIFFGVSSMLLLGYSAGEFQALQLIVLAVFGAVD